MTNPFEMLIARPVETDSWRWGRIVSVNPLRVQLDGDTEPLTATPDSLVWCVTGDRVRCHVYNRRVTVMGMPPNMQVDGVDGVVGKRNLANGWTHYGGFAPVMLSRDSAGVCYLSGVAKVGTTTNNTRILGIPSALTPAAQHFFIAHTAPSSASEPYMNVRVDLAGQDLLLVNGSRPLITGGHVTFEGIRWIPGQ